MNTRFIKQTLLLCAVGSAVLLTACSTTKTAKKTSPVPANIVVGAGPDRAIAVFALQYLGMPYVYGGSSPQTGFDCSGFTTYVFRNFGVSLNRSSKDQIKNGTAVSKSNLQPGDIVIFKNQGKTAIGHVGIYIGSGNFIHAANKKEGVVITALSSSYYSQRYVGARRVI